MIFGRRSSVLGLLLCTLATLLVQADDLVEFLNGSKARGTMKEIRKEKKEFDFEVQVGSQKLLRTYLFKNVHAVTTKGQRYVLTPTSSAGTSTAPAKTATKSPGTPSPETTDSEIRSNVLRTRAEIQQWIEQVGRTPPSWFDSTPLEYPKTLDLDWPLHPPEKGWNNQGNVGQYIWDIIHPNPDRWRGGIRLVHHLLTLHKDPALIQRDMTTLGTMYFELLQDYARAAFWLRQAKVAVGAPQSVMLAECYWRLGNKQMALELLNSPRLPMQAIKLYGDMGDTERAIKLANAFAKVQEHEACLLGGDACRQAGRLPQAIQFYQRVIDADEARNKDYSQRYRGRAADSLAAIKLFDQAVPAKVRNGEYVASSVGYNGQVEVRVRVAQGRIQDVQVVKHEEKQFYAALRDTTAQILKKQSVRGIDATSRATITSQAIVNAAAKALAEGAK